MQRIVWAAGVLALAATSSAWATSSPDGGRVVADAQADADWIRAVVAEALADSQTRTSLLSTGGVAGHDGRFFIGSADGNFRLQIGGDLQVRYYGGFGADDGSGDHYEGGFQNQRTRLDFRGHIISPKLTYRVQANFNRNGGGFELQDAWGEYALENGLKIRWGQFKLPFDRERVVSSTATQTLERSLVDAVFNLDRSQGVQLSYQAERWRISAAFSDGRRASNSEWTSAAEADFAFSARTEFRFGDAGWGQYRDLTSFRGDQSGLLIGLGGHWQQDGSTAAPAGARGTIDLFQYTADIGLEGGGWSLFGAVVGRSIRDHDDSFSDWGFLVQGGVFLNDNAELYARYARVMPDDDRPGGTDDFSAISAGMNWYFIPGSQAAKLTAEVTWYPDTQADSSSLISAPNSGLGLLRDVDGGQVAFGAQMQLLF
jgi:phosphate-selective porin OprO/OprP